MNTQAIDKHILVLGGAGYIGSVLVRRLLAAGYRVRVLDALLYDNRSAIDELMDQENFSFIHGNLCDAGTIRESLNSITDVVLLAALVGDPICKKYPDLARRVNDSGTINLINQLNGKGIDRLVFMSTCSNYGLRDTDREATEESDLNPQSLYAETKVKVERHILDSLSQFDFSPTILRCATAYGLSPRMRFDLTINEFTRELAVDNELLVYDPDTWRPYCHVQDISAAIKAVLKAPESSVSGEVFNVGSPGENYTKRMIVELLEQFIPHAVIRYREGSVDPRNYRVSFEKIVGKLGFSVEYCLKKFIPELVNAIKFGQFDDIADRKQFFGNFFISNITD